MHTFQPGQEGDTVGLPDHIEESVRSIVEFKAQHVRAATRVERAAERLTAALGRPAFLGCVLAIVGLWATLNLNARALHIPEFDPPPFSWLQGAISLTALGMTILVLATQRRLDRVAEERSQLTLQVALVGEQKTTKIIQLLEELRLDHPEIANRRDLQAEAMAEPTDPQTVLDALRESSDEIFLPSGPT